MAATRNPAAAAKCVAALAILTGLWLFSLRQARLPQPEVPLQVVATFDSAVPGQSDPLAVSGVPKAADFLFVRFVGRATAVIGYDSWGSPLRLSDPFPLAPEASHDFSIEIPGLSQYDGSPNAITDQVRVLVDGKKVLDFHGAYRAREPDQIYLGVNPLEGTSCGPSFHGTLRRPDGVRLKGRPTDYLPWTERIRFRLANDGWRLAPLALLAILIAWGAIPCAERLREALRPPLPWAALTAGLFVTLLFAFFVGGEAFRFATPESFGSFYDEQALSLLHGRLDVPQASISGEAFVFQGKAYGYFGLTPALMRIPVVALGIGFGAWSRTFMVLDFLICLVAARAILVCAHRLTGGMSGSPAPAVQALFLVAVGAGSPLLFLASRAYVYHEAILCGAAFVLCSVCASLQWEAKPAGGSWIGALVCGVLATHARPSAGLFALGVAGWVAVLHVMRALRAGPSARTQRARPFLVGVGCIAALFSFNVVSFLKFHTFDPAPFKYHVQYDALRLARMGGSNFHAVNVPFNLGAYFTRATFEFHRSFPYFFYTGRDPGGFVGTLAGVHYPAINFGKYPGIKMDIAEPMLGLPYAMPGLCLLALFGTAFAFACAPKARGPIIALWLGFLPFACAMLAAVATAERYTADFCPFLFAAAAIGLGSVSQSRARTALYSAWAVLTSWSVFTTLALTVHYQGAEVWGVPGETRDRYQILSRRVDRLFHLQDNDRH